MSENKSKGIRSPEEIRALLTRLQEARKRYLEAREKAEWDGYDTIEAELVDGFQKGVIAALEWVLDPERDTEPCGWVAAGLLHDECDVEVPVSWEWFLS